MTLANTSSNNFILIFLHRTYVPHHYMSTVSIHVLFFLYVSYVYSNCSFSCPTEIEHVLWLERDHFKKRKGLSSNQHFPGPASCSTSRGNKIADSSLTRLAENIWSKASAAPSDSVCLWLGRWNLGYLRCSDMMLIAESIYTPEKRTAGTPTIKKL